MEVEYMKYIYLNFGCKKKIVSVQTCSSATSLFSSICHWGRGEVGWDWIRLAR